MFKILFFGTYVPLHGASYIVKAAQLLEHELGIHFMFIGNGQDRQKIHNLVRSLELKNIAFKAMLEPVHLKQEIAGAYVCLGIFGNTPKTPLVIPNKVFEALAMGKAVITADTPAIRELFGEDELMLVPAADPEALADAIKKLKNDPTLRGRIAQRGHKKFLRTASYSVIGKELVAIINEHLH
jgi:glycosyltransferase involved in cell wall biosynthesis